MVNVEALTKRFGRQQVLRGVNASFEPGNVTAVVGPNASGKTTLLKCILGLVLPDSGSISINGQKALGNPASRALLGYMPQKAQFPENLRAKELFSWLQELRGQTRSELDELLSLFDLRSSLDKPLRVLSGGSKQKVSAVVAFLFDPEILILDEPTAGLDPVASRRLKDKILAERQRGRTVILTSHVMSELEELTDRLYFLLEGRSLFYGTLDEVRERTGQLRLESAVAKLMQEESL